MTRATQARRQTLTPSTLGPWFTRPQSSTTASATACRSRPAASQALATGNSSGSTTCSNSRASRRRSACRTVLASRLSRWNMRRVCATYSRSSVRMELASSSRAAMTASALGAARTAPEKSSSAPSSPHLVHVAFYLSLQAVHRHKYKSLTGPS